MTDVIEKARESVGTVDAVLKELADEIERLLAGIEEIQSHATKHMRRVAGQTHGPLSQIADLTWALLSVSCPGRDQDKDGAER